MVESRIISLEEEPDYVNILLYAKSGTGKTVFGGSDDKVLFIAPEDDGTMSAKRMGSKADKWPVSVWKDVQEAHEYLYDLPEIPFNWVVIDSITVMQQMMLRAILDAAVAENPSRDRDIPAIQDHQKWQNMFKRFVTAFNALECNVLWTGLVRNEVDEEGEDFLTPDIQGKGYQMSQTICSYMTSYGLMQAKRVKLKPKAEGDEPTYKIVRDITWEDTGVIQGKDRTGVLAPKTRDKTLKEIRHMIFPVAGQGQLTSTPAAPAAKRVAATRITKAG